MDARSWILPSVLRVLRITMLAYLGMVILLAGCQRRFIYYPVRMSMDEAQSLARYAGLEPWPDAGDAFAGWRRADHGNSRARRRVLVFHGNAGYALNRTYYLDGFDGLPDGEWDVILFEYPGYGSRSGKPSESSIMQAAETAFRALMEEDPAPVYLVGESLGSGPACRLAAENPDGIAGLWLITPFTSLADVAQVHYPIFPVSWILRDRFDNSKALQSYQGPLVVLVAGEDSVVPSRLGQRLYEEAATPYKCLEVQEKADHNTMDIGPRAAIWPKVGACWRMESSTVNKDAEVGPTSATKNR